MKLESVEEVSPLDPLDVPARLHDLRELRGGWFEGEGSSLSREGLEWFARLFEQYFSDDLPLPHIYPTAEGGLRAEWSEDSNAAILESNLDSHSASWLWFDRGSDAQNERELNLDDAEDCHWWVNEVRIRLG